MPKKESQIIDDIVRIICAHTNPYKIILFGSRSKGKNDSSSDFDVSVECEEVDDTLKRKIVDAIDGIRGLHKVDIVYLNEADDDFKDIILKTGKVIYDGRT